MQTWKNNIESKTKREEKHAYTWFKNSLQKSQLALKILCGPEKEDSSECLKLK